jgi:chromosome segregation ATPase
MARRSALLQLVLALVLVCNLFSVAAMAQDAPREVLFDRQQSEMAVVHTNGQTFSVYEYDNILPYASGIEIYSEGERVTSKATADEIFRALARRQATKFDPESRTIQRLRGVIDRSESVQAKTTDAIAALNETLAYRQTLKDTALDNSTAWDVAVDSSEELDEAFTGGIIGPSNAAELRDQLIKLDTSAEGLVTNATRVTGFLQDRQDGREINRSDLYRRYGGIHSELQDLRSRIESVREPLRVTADSSEAVASQVGSLETVGDGIGDRFSSLAGSLRTTERDLAEQRPAITELKTSLPQVATDEDFQKQLTNRWKARKSATTKIYGTVAEVGVVFVAVVIAFFETSGRLWVK